MPQLVPPHGSDSVKPLLLPASERTAERKRAEKLIGAALKRVHAVAESRP